MSSSFVKAGGVNWNAYDTNSIWEMLKNENVCTGQDRVLAWQTISEALASQHAGLTAARETLAAAWPPEKNDSARIFLQKIDFMLSSISDTMTKPRSTGPVDVGRELIVSAMGDSSGVRESPIT